MEDLHQEESLGIEVTKEGIPRTEKKNVMSRIQRTEKSQSNYSHRHHCDERHNENGSSLAGFKKRPVPPSSDNLR